jgi:hypothetical protein
MLQFDYRYVGSSRREVWFFLIFKMTNTSAARNVPDTQSAAQRGAENQAKPSQGVDGRRAAGELTRLCGPIQRVNPATRRDAQR